MFACKGLSNGHLHVKGIHEFIYFNLIFDDDTVKITIHIIQFIIVWQRLLIYIIKFSPYCILFILSYIIPHILQVSIFYVYILYHIIIHKMNTIKIIERRSTFLNDWWFIVFRYCFLKINNNYHVGYKYDFFPRCKSIFKYFYKKKVNSDILNNDESTHIFTL